MAKKKQAREDYNAPVRSVNELSDTEFITYADYLSSPYYRAYINAKCRADGANAYGAYSPAGRAVGAAAPAVKGKRYVKKRGFAQFLIALLMLLVVALGVIGFVGVPVLTDYAGIYKIPGVTAEDDVGMGLADPAVGLIKSFVTLDLDSLFYTNFMENKLDGAETMTKIALYAVPVAAAMMLIFALIGFIKALVAMGSKRKANGFYKKFKFGFISVVMLLCGLIVAVGGIYAAGIDIKGAVDFLTFKSVALQAGYGLYAAVGIPIITLILSCASYKKQK